MGIGVSVEDVDFVEGGGVVSRRALVLNAYLDDDVKFDVSMVTETFLCLRASNVELCFPTGNDLSRAAFLPNERSMQTNRLLKTYV